MKRMADHSVDGIFTDPPWGGRTKIMGNENPMALMRALDAEAPRILRPGGRVLIWIGTIQLAEFVRAFKNLKYRWMLLCHYIPSRYVARFQSQIDPILYFSLPGEKWPSFPYCRRQIYTKISTGKKDTRHPCGRPLNVVGEIISDWFRPGELILDPFAGSDTVGYACRKLGIKCRSYEIDPEMYLHALARHSQTMLFEKVGKCGI